jgi:hypothetical protein
MDTCTPSGWAVDENPAPDCYLPDEPSLRVVKSTVVPGDVVLHTVQVRGSFHD